MEVAAKMGSESKQQLIRLWLDDPAATYSKKSRQIACIEANLNGLINKTYLPPDFFNWLYLKPENQDLWEAFRSSGARVQAWFDSNSLVAFKIEFRGNQNLEYKVCKRCQRLKTFPDFYKKSGGLFDIDSTCSDCVLKSKEKKAKKTKMRKATKISITSFRSEAIDPASFVRSGLDSLAEALIQLELDSKSS